MTNIERLKIRAQAFEDAAREIEALGSDYCEECEGQGAPERFAEVLRTRANLIRSEIRILERSDKLKVSV